MKIYTPLVVRSRSKATAIRVIRKLAYQGEIKLLFSRRRWFRSEYIALGTRGPNAEITDSLIEHGYRFLGVIDPTTDLVKRALA
jgi:hypothetical protein